MEDIAKDSRDLPRKSLFAAATLYYGSGSAGVRIRNVSGRGALVEGPDLPEPGTDARLSRGRLSVVGEVRWARGNRAGIAFASQIDVADWLSSCVFRGHQERVDDVVAAIRVGSPLPEDGTSATISALAMNNPRGVVETLAKIKRVIETAAEDLAADPRILKQHATQLQSFDAAARMVGELIKKV